jgi:hypothetical protein
LLFSSFFIILTSFPFHTFFPSTKNSKCWKYSKHSKHSNRLFWTNNLLTKSFDLLNRLILHDRHSESIQSSWSLYQITKIFLSSHRHTPLTFFILWSSESLKSCVVIFKSI